MDVKVGVPYLSVPLVSFLSAVSICDGNSSFRYGRFEADTIYCDATASVNRLS